jgi:hypothetical protein
MYIVNDMFKPSLFQQYPIYRGVFIAMAIIIAALLFKILYKNFCMQSFRRSITEPYVWLIFILGMMFYIIDVVISFNLRNNLIESTLNLILLYSVVLFDSMKYRPRPLVLVAMAIYLLNAINLIIRFTWVQTFEKSFVFGDMMSDKELKRSILMNILSIVLPAFKRILFDKENKFLAFSVSPIFRLSGTTDIKWFDATYVSRRTNSIVDRARKISTAERAVETLEKRGPSSVIADSLSIFFGGHDESYDNTNMRKPRSSVFVNPTSCDGRVVEPGTEGAMASGMQAIEDELGAGNMGITSTQEREDDYLDIWS